MRTFRTVPLSYAREFATDKNGVYLKGRLVTADTVGLRILCNADGQIFWKTRFKVFDNERVMQDADAATFDAVMCFNIPYLIDKNFVYYEGKKIKGTDPASFTRTCSGPFYDKNYIYNGDSLLKYQGKILRSVNQIFGKTDSEVIYLQNRKPIKKVDARSLVGLSPSYSADRYHVYFDTTAFLATPEDMTQFKVWEQVNSRFFSDGKHLYDNGVLCEDTIDVKTFSMLPKSDIFYDKNGIYYKEWNEKNNRVDIKKYPFTYNVPVTAQNAFFSWNDRFIIYDNQVYDFSQGKIVTGLTASDIEKVKSIGLLSWRVSLSEFMHNSVKVIDPDLIARGNQLFYQDSLIRNFNPKLLSSLGYGYYKYKKGIYYFDRRTFKRLPKADIPTFKTTLNLTHDKNYVYKSADTILKSKDIELLAILAGPKEGGDEGYFYINYFIYKNFKGYWVKRSYEPQVRYLGRSLRQQFIEIPKEMISENTKAYQ